MLKISRSTKKFINLIKDFIVNNFTNKNTRQLKRNYGLRVLSILFIFYFSPDSPETVNMPYLKSSFRPPETQSISTPMVFCPGKQGGHVLPAQRPLIDMT